MGFWSKSNEPGRGNTFGRVNESVAKATRTTSPSPPAAGVISGIEVLPEYREVKALVDNRFPLIFVTGGAGTGKSTFIRWLASQFPGKTLICAPTGVAALSAGGKTIHRLCSFPPAWIVEGDIRFQEKSVARHADLLIIDEISMVNANLLDGVDRYFRLNRRSSAPFGGVSVVFVGDLFQLPPIVTDDTRELFENEYATPWFFSARAVRDTPFRAIELTKPFRQTDEDFVAILTGIREGRGLESVVEDLNTRAGVTNSPGPGRVWLCPRRAEAERVNVARLSALSPPSHRYEAVTKGIFKATNLSVGSSIELRAGAQVVLASNSASWVNGSIAVVESMQVDRIHVRLTATGAVVEVPEHTWEQYDYQWNEQRDIFERVVVGSFTQIPVILGWALTIHKSQGLTLDAVHLDLGAGSFAPGQTYVALSRGRSLETLSMSRALRPGDVKVDPQAQAFYEEIRRAR